MVDIFIENGRKNMAKVKIDFEGYSIRGKSLKKMP